MSVPSWHLLVLSLPGDNPAGRMRVWRALKACGSAVLRDGVYLLPAGEDRRAAFARVAEDVTAAGGTVHLLEASGADYAGQFDRTADYQQLAADITACRDDLDKVAAPDLGRLARKLRKAFAAVAATDFFPGQAQVQTGALLATLEDDIRARQFPGEPSTRHAAIEPRQPADYLGRVWATRRRPWVDRLASAWLIRRFIDRDARFIWIAAPADCPDDALGFDFDGAEFTHVGERVSFETLLASFGLEGDPGLARLARIVHYLDVGGLPAPEAAGLETLLAGMRASLADDDALLAAASQAFDFLYANYRNGDVKRD